MRLTINEIMRSIICRIFWIGLIYCTGCTKSTNYLPNSSNAGQWNLLYSVWNAAGTDTTYPAKDSGVTLQLDSNGNYQTRLNSLIICKGSYSITNTNTGYYQQILKLQSFTGTGIFKPLVLIQVNSNQQVAAIDTAAFYMTISHDTLSLIPDVSIPAGQESYTFIHP